MREHRETKDANDGRWQWREMGNKEGKRKVTEIELKEGLIMPPKLVA